MTDADIQSIIDNSTDDVLDLCGVTDESIPDIALAVRYTVLANVLKYMKTTGELAPSIKAGNGQRQNTPDKDIETYQKLADEITQPYIILKRSTFNSTFSSPTFTMGFNSCSGGSHGYH
ncbi:MAG: hypothetical protein ABFD07_16035 [Methanobacterium sp.]